MFQYVSCMCLFDVVVTEKYKMHLGGQKSHTHTTEVPKKRIQIRKHLIVFCDVNTCISLSF